MSAPAAAAPVATPQPQAPNLVDLDDLLSPTPAQGMGLLPQNMQQSIQHPSFGAQPATLPQVNSVPPNNAFAQQPASGQQQQQAPQQKPGGPVPMAARGNAAVEQGAGRQDPFADLFS